MKIYLNKNCLAPKGAMLKLSGKGKAWNLLLNNAMIVGVSLLVKFEVEYAAVTFESFFNQFPFILSIAFDPLLDWLGQSLYNLLLYTTWK